jgi:magnesium-protoporphyrin O-methyltransferase
MTTSYIERRGEIETYFDNTAMAAWTRLTSDAPVGRIRATVRAGRDRMRQTLLSFLPEDLHGARILDAGCGTGALAVEAARRGADVLAIDLSPQLIAIAQQRLPSTLGAGRIRFEAGDMLDPRHGRFDYIVAMDSLIHYELEDMTTMVARLASLANSAVHFTYAPRTPVLTVLHAVGRLFPRGDRAPAIEPAARMALINAIAARPELERWQPGREARIATGFYISHAQELIAS